MFVNKEAVGKRILQIRKKYGYSMQKFGEIIDNAPERLCKPVGKRV
mgnify:FL=1